MIFAHAPAGWLCASWIQRVWKRAEFTQKQIYLLLLIGAIGGLFPDIDLFYFHLVSATISHREFPTHTLFLYLPIFLVIGAIAYWRKKWFIYAAVWCFAIGLLSHLVTDSVGGAIMWLWPFSHESFGLFTISWISHSPQVENLLTYSLLMEGVWFTLFLWIWIPRLIKRLTKMLWKLLVCIFFLTWTIGFIQIHLHTTHLPASLFYSDQDYDGLNNVEDIDLDGDGLLNAQDADANADGVLNVDQVVASANSFDGVWTDPTQGNFIQILRRIGFLSNSDLIIRSFAPAGFFWRQEMMTDYAVHPDGYVSSPTTPDFEVQNENQRVYLLHQDKLTTGHELSFGKIKLGDVVFFAHGEPEGVVVGVSDQGLQIMRAQSGLGTAIDQVSAEEFPHTILAAGRVWL